MTSDEIYRLKMKIANYVADLSEVRGADFNSGQRHAFILIFQWLEEFKEPK